MTLCTVLHSFLNCCSIRAVPEVFNSAFYKLYIIPMQIWVQTLAFYRFKGEPKNNKAAACRKWQKRSSVLMLIINPGAAVPERPPGYSTATIILDDGDCTENSCAIWALINHSAQAKLLGIQATWKEAAWLRAILKDLAVRHWKSNVKSLVKGCKYTWALMILLPLPRTDQ